MTRCRYEIFVKTHWFSKNTLLQRYTCIADIYTHRHINTDTHQTPPHDEYILYIVKDIFAVLYGKRENKKPHKTSKQSL